MGWGNPKSYGRLGTWACRLSFRPSPGDLCLEQLDLRLGAVKA